MLLSFPIAPLATSAIHTVSRDSGSIPDLMLLQEGSPPAPPVKTFPPTPDFSSAWRYHPALAEQSIRKNTRTTSSQCQSLKHTNQKPHPDPEPYSGHRTEIKHRTQYYFALKSISLFPFPTCLPMGPCTAGGRTHPATGHNDMTSQNSTKDFSQLLPKADSPAPGARSRDTGPSPPALAVTQPGARPLRKEYKVLVENPALPSRGVLRRASHIAASLRQGGSVTAAHGC